MKIFEYGYLSQQELNINWTVPFSQKDDNNSDINGKTGKQQMSKSQVHDKSSD
jgi:hypothetical protein